MLAEDRAKIIDCIGLGSDVVYLSVDEGIDYSDAINSLFYEPPYQFSPVLKLSTHNILTPLTMKTYPYSSEKRRKL